MNVRIALLGLFVGLTVVLASTTVYEAGSRTTVTSTSVVTVVSSSTLTQTSTVTATSTTVDVSPPCVTSYTYPTNPISVLVATSGSTASICVKYWDPENTTVSEPTFHDVYQVNSSGSYLVTSIRVVPSASSVTFEVANQGQVQNVTYSVIVPANVTGGIYRLNIPGFIQANLPLVVVPTSNSPPQLNSSDPYAFSPCLGSCTVDPFDASILGVGGFTIASVS